MSLLGGIVKTTEALRYHSKSAEIAGQNLAHVNDESYARQRVLTREGVMYNSAEGLLTSGLEVGGLDHARNDLIDARVITETGQTSSLSAQKEILELLQGALGEKITRQGVNVGLDDLHESDLAPGSLTRAMNDFFNAFQELSASPHEETIKQELLHKIDTLTKRFNEAGESLENIESDLSETIRRSVEDVNRILSQIHQVNTQVRRFELLDKGKAVSYRDRRQALLEELSTYINFKTEDDISTATGKPSGFVNIFVDGVNGEKVNILDSTGTKPMTNDWGQEFTLALPSNPDGTAAKVRAKIDSSGQLGRFEVLDSGSKYDDSKGPFIVSLLPPISPATTLQNNTVVAPIDEANQALVQTAPELMANQPVDTGNELANTTGGEIGTSVTSDPALTSRVLNEVFHEGGVYYQALSNTQKGDLLSDETKFMKISNPPSGVISETKRTFSDIEFIGKGEQVYYEGKLYQATTDVGPYISESGILEPETQVLGSSRNYLSGEVFKYNDVFYQAINDVGKGAELSTLSASAGTVNSSGIVTLGASLPLKSELANVQWPNGNDVAKGQIISFKDPDSTTDGDFYIALDTVNASSPEIPSTSTNFTRVGVFVDDTIENVSNLPQTQTLLVNNVEVTDVQIAFEDGKVYYDDASQSHFLVKASPKPITGDANVNSFNPNDSKWSNHFHVFNPDPNSGLNVNSIARKSYPSGLNVTNGSLQEVKIGVAEAIIENGEVKSFNILQTGNDLPSTDTIFANGVELVIDSGSIHGYQTSRLNDLETFRKSLNGLVSEFVTQVNTIYNPEDEPGAYLFGFEANLTRPKLGRNVIMEEEFGLYGVEGNGEMKMYPNEVSMTLAYAESDTFTVTSTTPVMPKELKQQFENTGYIIRDDAAEGFELEDPNSGSIYTFYASARRMQNVSLETDSNYPGEDLLLGTADDGRSIMLAYQNVPFRLEQGDKEFLLGDNFSFDAVLENSWNLASSLIVDKNLDVESIRASLDDDQGANELALKISELSNGEFTKQIASINSDLGNSLSDIGDNLDHHTTIENLLLDQRRAVSSVSVDEEVSDLMVFQRSFQASSRVLNTLDKMLELVVMGLIK